MTPYSKLNSQGNDFILVERHLIKSELTQKEIIKYSSRDNIGCDQFFIVDTSDKKNIRCDVYNQDGSKVCQCGNGVRATMLFVKKKYNLDTANIIICQKSYQAKIIENLISVNMGQYTLLEYPKNVNKKLLLLNNGFFTTVESENNINFSFMPLSIGNEHCVVFSKNCLQNKNIISKIIENIFQREMNIGFVDNLDDFLNDVSSIVELTVKERGSGYTKSCGSGATAAAICLFKLYELKKERRVKTSKILIQQEGGILEVTEKIEPNSYELSGPSSFDGDGYLG